MLFLSNRGHIRPCVNVVLHDGGVHSRHFCVCPTNMSWNSWKRDLYCTISMGEHDAPRKMCSTQSGTIQMPTLIVMEILAMLPSSKEYGVGMGFVNQSTRFGGMEYLAFTAYFWEYSGKMCASHGEIGGGQWLSTRRSSTFSNASIMCAST